MRVGLLQSLLFLFVLSLSNSIQSPIAIDQRQLFFVRLVYCRLPLPYGNRFYPTHILRIDLCFEFLYAADKQHHRLRESRVRDLFDLSSNFVKRQISIPNALPEHEILICSVRPHSFETRH